MGNDRFDVINFHLTEKCNYRCIYCFAKFKVQDECNIANWKYAVDVVSDYFTKNDITDGRINLAGGEPLLVDFLDDLIDYIYEKRIKVSIITNASMLTKEHIDKWVDKVEMIGISIDSINSETNLLIGRCMSRGVVNNIDDIANVLQYAKNKGFLIKVNTVVSRLNIHEDLLEFYEKVQFDRIKLLQMRVNYNCNEQSIEYGISQKEFAKYCEKVKHINGVIIELDVDLECSYIIIDPKGNFVTNKNQKHKIIGSILKDNLDELIMKAELNISTFRKRYQVKEGVIT